MGGEEAAGDERAWLRGQLRTANGWEELRGRLRTAWVQGGSGEEAAGDGRAWLRGRLRTANGWGNCADGCGRRGCQGVAGNGLGGEKKPLGMSERGCADGCGRQMGAENCADGCGRRGCKGVAGNGSGEEAAGDERAWLRGRLRTANGVGRIARTAVDGVGAREWLEMGGEKKPLEMSELGCADGCGREMGAENGADGCGRRGCKGVAGNRRGEEQDAAHEPEMDMQSLRTIFLQIVYLNSLVYTYFPRYQSAVWSGQCRVWSVECKV